MIQLSENVKQLREKMHWTQEDLARKMYVSLSTIQRWELKGGNPNRLTCQQLGKLLRKAGISDEQNSKLTRMRNIRAYE